jgi:hypothetical protein
LDIARIGSSSKKQVSFIYPTGNMMAQQPLKSPECGRIKIEKLFKKNGIVANVLAFITFGPTHAYLNNTHKFDGLIY